MSECVKKKVCVIGAGAAGLCCAKFLSEDSDFFEFSVFEKNNAIGGTWIYTDETDNDEYGLPIHTSMYKNLRSNAPNKIQGFPDFPKLGSDDGMFCNATHEELLQYLNDYTDYFDLRKFIKLNTIVERVIPTNSDNDNTTWNVSIKNLKTKESSNLTFDALMICNGHYAVTNIPKIPGIETFPGRILHSHYYRKPEEFEGQKVLLLGAGLSGCDISCEISQYASVTYLSHNKKKLSGKLPSNINQVTGVQRVEGNQIILIDETTIVADTFIYCTGYLYDFPFLDKSCKIVVDDNRVTPLYKELMNIYHPSMALIGLGCHVATFLMFHYQAQYFLCYLKGLVKLPSRALMLKQFESEIVVKNKDYHKWGCKQWVYFKDFSKEGNFEAPPKFYEKAYDIWKVILTQNLVNYQYFKLILLEDGESVKYLNPDGSDYVLDTKTTIIPC